MQNRFLINSIMTKYQYFMKKTHTTLCKLVHASLSVDHVLLIKPEQCISVHTERNRSTFAWSLKLDGGRKRRHFLEWTLTEHVFDLL